MKIGKQQNQATAISTSNADMIVVRGKDLCRDLIGSVAELGYATDEIARLKAGKVA